MDDAHKVVRTSEEKCPFKLSGPSLQGLGFGGKFFLNTIRLPATASWYSSVAAPACILTP